MKYLCLISHKQPGTEPGKFKAFEAGREYEAQEIGDVCPGYWRAVYGLGAMQIAESPIASEQVSLRNKKQKLSSASSAVEKLTGGIE